MKNQFMFILAISASLFLSFTPVTPHSDVYQVEATVSSLEWYAAKATGKHNGTIMLSKGQIVNNHGKFSGSFEVDMTSIANKDIESAEYRTKLENHLKSADFFDVAKFPVATFILTSLAPLAEPKDGKTHAVKGMLTIKDKTNEISFNATVKMESNKLFATGDAIVDRSKFDVKYGSKSFFADIGDKVIYDEFTLKFNIAASR